MSDDFDIPAEKVCGVWEYADRTTKVWFDEAVALADLLQAGKVCLGSRWWTKKEQISVAVNCSDVFVLAYADAEELPYDQIETLWRMYRQDPKWGTDVWCMQRRKQMPHQLIEKVIREGGLWDLDSMDLAPNIRPAESKP